MYTKKKCKIYVLSVLLCTFFFSCSSIDFELPQGPQGTNGKSAYEIWKEEVETGHINWPSTQVDLADFLVYIKGEKGDKRGCGTKWGQSLSGNGTYLLCSVGRLCEQPG